MRNAAVARLKAGLSGFLARVKGGEELIVTERGRPIAKIVPLRRDPGQMSARLKELEKAGLIKIGTGRVLKKFWTMPRANDPHGRALEALIGERRDGR